MQWTFWEPPSTVRSVATILGTLALALGSVLPTQAATINCGDVLGPGGRFQLEQDLTCPDTALTIRDGAILDLNGHRVTCSILPLGCVVLTGNEAQLWNGTVEGGAHEAIILEGTGGHTLRDVTSLLTDANIMVESDNNRLMNVMAESVESAAFLILGHHNRLTNSMALCPFVSAGCIAVSGDENHVSDNIVSVEEDFDFPPLGGRGGISITGNNNQLRRNHVTNNNGPGIVVQGTGNDLRFNTAQGTSFDLVDTTSDCTHNTWEYNIYTTSAPSCIDAGRTPGALMAR